MDHVSVREFCIELFSYLWNRSENKSFFITLSLGRLLLIKAVFQDCLSLVEVYKDPRRLHSVRHNSVRHALCLFCLFYLATTVWFRAEEDFQGFRDVSSLLQSSTLSPSRERVARQLWEPSDRVQTVVLCLQRAYCLYITASLEWWFLFWGNGSVYYTLLHIDSQITVKCKWFGSYINGFELSDRC